MFSAESGSSVDPEQIQDREQFKDAMQALRESRGLSYRDVERQVGIPRSTVSAYCNADSLPYLSGRANFCRLLSVFGVTGAETLKSWWRAVERVRRKPGPRAPGGDSPYRGLTPFTRQDSDWFFGREALTAQVLGMLEKRIDTGGVLPVVGSSGSGKSSLLQAGVLAAVDARRFDEGRAWMPVTVSPGTTPCLRLLDAVREEEFAGEYPSPAVAGLIRKAVRNRLENSEYAGMVLVVDQFEEVFGPDVGTDERELFLDVVTALADASSTVRVLVVLGIRDDFYDRLGRDPRLVSAANAGQVLMGSMSWEDVREVITGPANKAGLTIDKELTELLLSDLAPAQRFEATMLPLLSYALQKTWENREENRLTVKAYHKIGRLQDAIARAADGVYEQLSPAGRERARALFLRLVYTSDTAPDLRRRIPVGELPDWEGEAGDDALAQFMRARLVFLSDDGIELAHEALVSAWPRLLDWLAEGRAEYAIYRALNRAARAWQQSGRDDELLYRRRQLLAAHELRHDTVELNTLERAFLAASIDREAEDVRAAERGRRTRRRLWLAAAAVALVVAVLLSYEITQGIATSREENRTDSRELAAQADRFRASDPALAAQLSLAAYRIEPTAQARASVLDATSDPIPTRMPGPAQVLQSVAADPAGRVLATAGEHRSIQLWDLTRPGRPSQLGTPVPAGTDTIFSLAFDPTGRPLLASGGGAGQARLWTVRDGAGLVPVGPELPGLTGTVYSVAFAPGGRLLAVGGSDNLVHLFDITDPARPAPVGTPLGGAAGYVQSVAFSPDGHTIAAGSADRTVRRWDVTNPAVAHPLGGPMAGPTGRIYAVAFSPDGSALAAGGSDKTLYVWNLAEPGKAPSMLTEATGRINSIAFASDSRTVAAGGSDNTVRVWDRVTGQVVVALPHPAPVTAVQFTGNGTQLATSAADGTVRLWPRNSRRIGDRADAVFGLEYADAGNVAAVSTGRAAGTVEVWRIGAAGPPAQLSPGLGSRTPGSTYASSVALSPDGRILASGTDDGAIELWDVHDPAHPVASGRLQLGTKIVQTLTFSSDSKLLTAGGDDKTVGVWDVTDHARPRRLAVLRDPSNSVYSVEFSADSRVVAAASLDGKVYCWDLADPAEPRALPPLGGFAGYVHSVAFDPQRRVLAAGSADKTVRLWDLADPAHPRELGGPLSGPTNYVYSVAFSPDGHTLAAGSADHTIWTWDVTDPAAPRWLATLSAAHDTVFGVVFSPDGKTMAAGTSERAVRLWSTDPEQAAEMVCAAVGAPITREEWARYVPNHSYRPPCE